MVTFDETERPPVRERETLAPDVSHDLRSPLAVIRMQAQMLMRLVKRGPTADDAFERERLMIGLQRIDEAVTTLNGVIERATTERTRLPIPGGDRNDIH